MFYRKPTRGCFWCLNLAQSAAWKLKTVSRYVLLVDSDYSKITLREKEKQIPNIFRNFQNKWLLEIFWVETSNFTKKVTVRRCTIKKQQKIYRKPLVLESFFNNSSIFQSWWKLDHRIFSTRVGMQISKRALHESKAHQVFRKTNIVYPLIRTSNRG